MKILFPLCFKQIKKRPHLSCERFIGFYMAYKKLFSNNNTLQPVISSSRRDNAFERSRLLRGSWSYACFHRPTRAFCSGI